MLWLLLQMVQVSDSTFKETLCMAPVYANKIEKHIRFIHQSEQKVKYPTNESA